MTEELTSSDPRVFFAAERTFLAWIRTGLALMGFGFVVARFGLFLRELQYARPELPVSKVGYSFWFGTALIAIGVIVNLFSVWNHIRLIRELDSGGTSFKRPSRMAITIAVVLAIVGLAMAFYLIGAWGR